MSPSIPSIPRKPLYLFYGTQTGDILASRDAVLAAVFPGGEGRNENLTEYAPPSGQGKVAMAQIFDELAGDLATLSFIPDAPKCVVVTNPAELFGGGGGRGGDDDDEGSEGGGRKKTGADKKAGAFLSWVENDLPPSGHTLVLLAFEDEASQLEVNQKTALFQLVLKLGHLQRFAPRDKAFFRIEGAILRRDAAGCLRAIRELWSAPSGKGQTPVYNSIVRCLRLLLQANIARERKILNDPAAQAVYFPAAQPFNLLKAHPTVMQKYLNTPLYRTLDLIQAYEGMLDVYRALRPRPDDAYVPDQLGLLEQTLVRLMASPLPR